MFKDIIIAKRDGLALSRQAIGEFVGGLSDHSLPAEQISALAMAILLRGMSDQETGWLTQAMAASGIMLDWHHEGLAGPVVDKHSTGGVGDKVSLMLAPIVAACGGYVPMISGRGLGHTGGTLDKMSAIAGYRVDPDLALLRKVVREVGCAIIGQTSDLAPADRRLYAIRDVTGTVESIPLITASILSKKVAAGLQALVMDVKVGSGAFMREQAQAQALAGSIIGAGEAAGLRVRALITDMNEPLGTSIGNALEVHEAVAYLTGNQREARLHAITMALAGEMLVASGLAPDREAGAARALAALESGQAAERFAHMVRALSGPGDFLENPARHLPKAAHHAPIFAREAGFLSATDGRAIGNALIGLGGGRRQQDDVLDLATGFTEVQPIGTAVGPDAPPLAIAHAASPAALEGAIRAYLAACEISPAPPASRPLITAHLPLTRQ